MTLSNNITPLVVIILVLHISTLTSSSEHRRTKVLLPEEQYENPNENDDVWKKHPLFPFSRHSVTTPSPATLKINHIRPGLINWRPGWLQNPPVRPWFTTRRPIVVSVASPVVSGPGGIFVPSAGTSGIIGTSGVSISPVSAPISPVFINPWNPLTTTAAPELELISSSNYCVCVDSEDECATQVQLKKSKKQCGEKPYLCCNDKLSPTTSTESSVTINLLQASEVDMNSNSSNLNSPMELLSSTSSSANNNTFDIPVDLIPSSCQCLRSLNRCPLTYVALHLVSCPGITCCKPKRPSTNRPPLTESCRCILGENCETNNEEMTKQITPFCKPPYKLCCPANSNNNLEVQTSSETLTFEPLDGFSNTPPSLTNGFQTVPPTVLHGFENTPSSQAQVSSNDEESSFLPNSTLVVSESPYAPLPNNKVCKCVISALYCPPHGDILYDGEIDIRFFCPKPNLICCTSPIHVTPGIESTLPVQVTTSLPTQTNDVMYESTSHNEISAASQVNIPETTIPSNYYENEVTPPTNTELNEFTPPTVEEYEITPSSQADEFIEAIPTTTPTAIKLPPNKICQCVRTASQCPRHADILYDVNIIDIRNSLYCPKPNLICCVSPSHFDSQAATSNRPIEILTTTLTPVAKPPINITNEERCSCMDKPDLCPKDHLIIPEFIGVRCGRPRVWCCKPEKPVIQQTDTMIGEWCHCTENKHCKTYRMDNKISESICGEKTLCCEDKNTAKPTITTSMMKKCIFKPLYPDEGTCTCLEEEYCLENAGAFVSDVPSMCPSPKVACCRALRQCGLSPRSRTQDLPWVAAIVTQTLTRGPKILCSAIVVHRLAVLVPSSCVNKQALSSLTVVVGVGSAACGLEVGTIVPHEEFSLVLLKDAPKTTAHNFSPVCLPSSNSTIDNIDQDNCLSVSLVEDQNNRNFVVRQEFVKLTTGSECNAINILQKPNELCVRNKVDYEFDRPCAGGWGAAVMCVTRDVTPRLSLVGVHTRKRKNCASNSSLLTSTDNSWLSETLKYLTSLCPLS